jgi:hypothetical protein
MLIHKTNGDIDTLSISQIEGITFSTYIPEITTDGLLIYLPLDGNANDESGNNKNGILNGSPSFNFDRFGNESKSLHFDGENDFIEVESIDHPLGNSSFTYSLWVRSPVIASDRWRPLIYLGEHIANKTSGFYEEATTNSSYINFTIDGSYVRFNFTLNSVKNIWTHLAITKSGNDVSLYANGQFINSDVITGQNLEKNKLWIGGPGVDTEFFIGDIDDIRIYNRPLQQYEIKDLYHENGW